MFMKLILLETAFLMTSFHIYAQELRRNSFGMSIGTGIPATLSFKGAGGPDGMTVEAGFNYYRQMTGKIKFETGLMWHRNKFEISNDSPPFTSYHYDVGLLYIPLLFRFTFAKYMFLQAGPLVDIDPRMNRTVKSQTGLGAGLGFGVEFPVLKKCVIQFSSYMNLHSLAILKKDGYYPNPLCDIGMIKIGVRTR